MGQCLFQQNLDNCIGKSGNKASHRCLISGLGVGSFWTAAGHGNQENSIEFKSRELSVFLPVRRGQVSLILAFKPQQNP